MVRVYVDGVLDVVNTYWLTSIGGGGVSRGVAAEGGRPSEMVSESAPLSWASAQVTFPSSIQTKCSSVIYPRGGLVEDETLSDVEVGAQSGGAGSDVEVGRLARDSAIRGGGLICP